jgi:YVTN family beta-propeller protein
MKVSYRCIARDIRTGQGMAINIFNHLGRINMNRHLIFRATMVIAVLLIITFASTRIRAASGMCGDGTTTLPFTDVPATNGFFCSIASAYFTGLTNGTTPTTYSPEANVRREQMAAFVTRTLDQSLKRGSRRAALNQWWTPQLNLAVGVTTVGLHPFGVQSDGADLWVANHDSGTVSRVRASDGALLGTWTGAIGAFQVLVAEGLVFVTGALSPAGKVYVIFPNTSPGPVLPLLSDVGDTPIGIAYDGVRVWTANFGSVSIFNVQTGTLDTVTTGFIRPYGILYDGSNIWVTDTTAATALKLDSAGNIIQTVPVGLNPRFPIFDGANIWVPNAGSNSVTVIRASTGQVLATLTANGLSGPVTAAFDGERILVTDSSADRVSLWKAVDLTPLGSSTISTPGFFPYGACSDGLNFWITLSGTTGLKRL